MNLIQRQRIYQARRAASLARIVSLGWSYDLAEAALGAWETHADADGRSRDDAAYWDGAEAWMIDWRRRSR
jgi:hypothetical protein